MAVEAGFDTDCNGATVGSIFGMAHGFESIPDYWQKPIGDKLKTTIFGIGTLSISETAKKTMSQIIGLLFQAYSHKIATNINTMFVAFYLFTN